MFTVAAAAVVVVVVVVVVMVVVVVVVVVGGGVVVVDLQNNWPKSVIHLVVSSPSALFGKSPLMSNLWVNPQISQ